ncbi:Tetratricopeptide repeat-containing protein [Chitinophaga sp. YR627]|uniref:tetratricopeptide repeat protein n=1 Tax=Chitinophaga sp. YR627 TaxID=1881041 RepID=UPI0008F14AE4|nr:tetratricopeptide repeat protein [Chitinophaga sp. YR627]SFO67383.1 Tetratricopeptide repeat-containing protein [Chitinophaga sp. YR627]
MSNLENNEKILKIFSNIRCLNRDQLPRYVDGRLTDVEKHLVEQHLVDCDLCFDALQVLQQQQYREKYQPLSASMLQYIRSSIKQVSHAHKAERYQRQEQKKESFLIYFWVVAAIAAGAGLIYLIQQQEKFKAPVTKAMASNTEIPAPAMNASAVQAAVVTPVRAETADTLRHHPAPPAAATTAPVAPPAATPAPAVPKPVVKDSVKAKVPAAAPVNKDSAKKQAPPATKPAEVKEAVKAPAPEHKDTPTIAKKTEDKPEPKPVPKEKKDDDDDKPKPKPATESAPSGTDEFLYKAAMVYHQQGDLNEAISRYKHLSGSSGKYGELSRYQLAVCYRSKGQTGKARRMFKEVVRMNGSMKDKAQAALDNL